MTTSLTILEDENLRGTRLQQSVAERVLSPDQGLRLAQELYQHSALAAEFSSVTALFAYLKSKARRALAPA